MSDNKDISPEMAAKIAAIKARMKGGDGGGDSAEKPAEAEKPAASEGGGDAPAGDKAAQIAAIKARLAQGKKSDGGGSAAPAAAASGGEAADAGGDAGGEDMQAKIAALKAKVDAGKGKTAPAAAAAATKAKPAAKKGGGKNVFPVQPINRKIYGDDRLYGDATVSKWFLVSGLVLLISVFMMWGRDHVRGWKPIQKAHRENQIARLNAEIALAESAIDADTLTEVTSAYDAAVAALDAQADSADDLQAEIDRRDGTYYAANQKFQIAKSEFDEMRFLFEEQRILHGGDTELMEDSQAAIEAKTAEVAELKLIADNAKLELDAAKGDLKELEADVVDLEREKAGLEEAVARLKATEAKIGKAGIAGFFNEIRNLPVLDMLSPTERVGKIDLTELQDNYNFMYVDKVDMCITCHVSIDDPYYSDWDPDNSKTDNGIPGERVLNAHPRLDLFVADKSPHPMGRFGCTVCHQGRGQAVEFERTFHTPTADQWETKEEKTERWVADYGYDPERHYWDWPMSSTDKTYESCYQCHQEEHRLPGVPQYNESRALVEDLGCYGCHKIEGFEHLRKTGPDLTNLAAKVDEEWTQKWVMAPRDFRPTTRMPHFWDLSNSGGPGDPRQTKGRPVHNNSDMHVPDWRARNAVEGRAVVAYLYEQSRTAMAEGSTFELMTPPSRAGDPDAGREAFEARGCLGCHSVESEDWLLNDHGPDLSAIGSKAPAEWLYSWILDPKSYYETTVMPDLRLTEDEAWDITAWLLTLRDEAWEAEPAPAADRKILESIAVEYMSSIAGDDWARTEIAAMRAEGGESAVEVYVGEKLFNRYGCSGCHLVPGHYDDVGIGTELTYESLKELSKFDFGHEAAHGNPESVGHSREAFYRHKLIDPRVYDRMPVIVHGDDGQPVISRYDQKVKFPGEKLKMPNFGLDDREVELLTQFVLGLREDGIRETIQNHLDADEQLIEQGSQLITQYNCIGCHRMGQLPQLVTLEGEDWDTQFEAFEALVDEGLEYGLWMAEDFVVDETMLAAHGQWLLDEYYDPEYEESADILEFFEDDPDNRPFPDHLLVYGKTEGAMGEYIDDAAMRPPVFRDEGAKVNPDWLFEFLIQPYILRTHVNVRMPTFGLDDQESLALVRWFAAQNDQPWPFEVDADPVMDQELYDRGEAIFNEFQCNQCHPSGDVMPSNPDPSNWGPNLAMAAERLKPDWVHGWIKDPQQLAPGTRMPNFTGEYSDGEYSPYYDDWEDRVRALTHYLKHMDDGGSM